MKYFASVQDTNGYTYSIDNTIFEYSLKYPNLKDDLITYCYELQKNHNIHDEFWTRLNLKPSSHWSWCSDVVHLCNGIYLSIGKWNYIRDKKEPLYIPVVKLEVNLNKHSDKDVLSDLLQWLKVYCVSCYLIKYDVAVDIPLPKEDIDILGSRKERGLYKGTRYYGQRNKHGYTKIYDKIKEMHENGACLGNASDIFVSVAHDVDERKTEKSAACLGNASDIFVSVAHDVDERKTEKSAACLGNASDIRKRALTRVETTLVYKKGMQFENIYVKERENIQEEKHTKTIDAVLMMLQDLDALGQDINKYLDVFEWRQRKQIKEILEKGTYKKVSIDTDLVKSLLKEVRKKVPFQEPPKYYYEDPDGFLRIDDNYNLPWN